METFSINFADISIFWWNNILTFLHFPSELDYWISWILNLWLFWSFCAAVRQPEVLWPEPDLRSPPLYCLILVCVSGHILLTLCQKKASLVHWLSIQIRYTGQKDETLFIIWTIGGPLDRTSSQSVVKLSLLCRNSLNPRFVPANTSVYLVWKL